MSEAVTCLIRKYLSGNTNIANVTMLLHSSHAYKHISFISFSSFAVYTHVSLIKNSYEPKKIVLALRVCGYCGRSAIGEHSQRIYCPEKT